MPMWTGWGPHSGLCEQQLRTGQQSAPGLRLCALEVLEWESPQKLCLHESACFPGEKARGLVRFPGTA